MKGWVLGFMNILIVEDEAIIYEDLRKIISNAGCNVIGNSISGEEAIKKVKKDKPELVLMDIMLKGNMNGIEAAEYIKKNFDIPIIFITAYADHVNSVGQIKPYAYIVKPFNEKVIIETIKLLFYKENILKGLYRKIQELQKIDVNSNDNRQIIDDIGSLSKKIKKYENELMLYLK
jgi:DNA-binding NarL/FixJ family response regulator